MGDRICLQFRYKGERSPVLYAHWDGKDILEWARTFWNDYKDKIRREPSNWMVNFIKTLNGGEVVDGSYYIYSEGEESSPDDNGNWVFNLESGKYRRVGDDWKYL